MAIKTVITCDITGKEMNKNDLETATVCAISYKKIGKVLGFNGQPDIKCLTDIENYEFHISAEKAPQFMEELKKIFVKLKGE